MTKEVIYTYIGTNGMVSSPIHLEGISAIKKIHLIAGENKKLTDGETQTKEVWVSSEEDAEKWTEINQ
jgi:hypothetical protein